MCVVAGPWMDISRNRRCLRGFDCVDSLVDARAYQPACRSVFAGAAVALGIVVLLWALANCWTVVTSSLTANTEPFLVLIARNVVGLQIPAVLLFAFFSGWIMRLRSKLAPTLLSMILLVFGAVILPGSFSHIGPVGSFTDSKSFVEWQAAIPPTSSVFVADGRNSGELVWFTLLRTNYLTATQSTGVVFSRETALEVRRRSEVLLPLMNPSWKVMTNNEQIRSGKSEQSVRAVQPLTEKSLVAICSDPQLGFVVSRQDIGFEALRHGERRRMERLEPLRLPACAYPSGGDMMRSMTVLDPWQIAH